MGHEISGKPVHRRRLMPWRGEEEPSRLEIDEQTDIVVPPSARSFIDPDRRHS